MKKIKCAAVLFMAVLAVFVTAVVGSLQTTAQAASSAYTFEINSYSVTMDVSANRTVGVTEVIEVYFTGYSSHDIIRDLLLDSGVRYKDIEVTCDNDDFSPYTQDDNSAYLSLYLRGDGNVYGETRTYIISYTMTVPALSDKTYLPLDVIGYGWDYGMSDVMVTVTVPDGLNDYVVYSGASGTTQNSYADCSYSGNIINITADYLPDDCGITLDLSFEEGVLTTAFDWGILWGLLIGIALIALIVVLKITVCREPDMTVTVNLDAPEEMDPLLMGKYIDNKVDSEDLGAAIFYLADKGYLTIDMSDEKKPALYITDKKPYADEPEHIRFIYSGLFKNRESVTTSALQNTFYKTADMATSKVNAQTKGKFYNKKTIAFALLAGVLVLFVMALFHLIYPSIAVYTGYRYMAGVVICSVGFVINALAGITIKQRQYKWKKGKKIAVMAVTLAVGLAFSFVCMLFRCSAYGTITIVMTGAVSSILGMMCGMLYTRSDDYNKKMGHIMGFKQFIQFADKDKIEFYLKDNPELYYHVLPYAQVLGVTDVWTDKFKGIDIQPPHYVRNSVWDTAFDLYVWNRMFRSMNTRLVGGMTSRPSSGPSGGGGGHGGGFGGGFGGGGFGGGGGRGC